jgi:hypothetical protein
VGLEGQALVGTDMHVGRVWSVGMGNGPGDRRGDQKLV